MSLITMSQELTGRVPNLDIDLAITMIREAWHSIRKQRGWSFQLAQGGFAAPSQYALGTVSVTYGATQVIADATATTGWATLSQFGSLISQRQFRIGGGTIYDIVAYDTTTNPPFATITLDRPFIDYQEATTGLSYLIYQPYYPAPVKDFIRWLAIRDMTNVRWLNVNADYDTRRATDMADPQRQIYTPPLVVLPLGTDTRANSSTLGYMRYELYPQPSSQIVYQDWYEWEGPDLVNDTDTLPDPISEICVKSKALVDAYGVAEGNKDPANPRGSGADFRFLAGQYQSMYTTELQSCRTSDRERVSMFSAQMSRVGSPAPFSTWNPSTGVLSVSNLAATS
jgi:hypothetical protein